MADTDLLPTVRTGLKPIGWTKVSRRDEALVFVLVEVRVIQGGKLPFGESIMNKCAVRVPRLAHLKRFIISALLIMAQW
jgi:hypothetical protein